MQTSATPNLSRRRSRVAKNMQSSSLLHTGVPLSIKKSEAHGASLRIPRTIRRTRRGGVSHNAENDIQTEGGKALGSRNVSTLTKLLTVDHDASVLHRNIDVAERGLGLMSKLLSDSFAEFRIPFFEWSDFGGKGSRGEGKQSNFSVY